MLTVCAVSCSAGPPSGDREGCRVKGSFGGPWIFLGPGGRCRIRSGPQRSTSFIHQALWIRTPAVPASVAGLASHALVCFPSESPGYGQLHSKQGIEQHLQFPLLEVKGRVRMLYQPTKDWDHRIEHSSNFLAFPVASMSRAQRGPTRGSSLGRSSMHPASSC